MKGRELLTILFLLFAVLLVWPILTIVNTPLLVFGIPLLPFYLFIVWAAIIAALFISWTCRTNDRP